jgi:hypothetical protein
MQRARFINSGITSDVYFPPTDVTPSETGLYTYGFPGSIGVNAVTDFLLQDRDQVVVQPHYAGTYDSAGFFSPVVAIESITTVGIAVAESKAVNIKNNESLLIPPTLTTLVGHSFGCFAALHAAPSLSSLRTLLLLGPAISFGEGPLGCGVKEDGAWQIAYVRRSRPFTYRLAPEDTWLSMYCGDLNEPSDPASSSSIQRVVGMVGTDDKYFNLKLLEERFEQIVRLYVGSDPRVELLMVEGADHAAASLLTLGRDDLLAALGR